MKPTAGRYRICSTKLRAINLHKAGVDIALVTTIINGINNDQVGPIIQFAMDNPKKIAFVSFQPVSFTGRDEENDERRFRQRHAFASAGTSSQLGVRNRSGMVPISLIVSSDFGDLVHGPQANWGHLCCSCYPDCGVGTGFR